VQLVNLDVFEKYDIFVSATRHVVGREVFADDDLFVVNVLMVPLYMVITHVATTERAEIVRARKRH